MTTIPRLAIAPDCHRPTLQQLVIHSSAGIHSHYRLLESLRRNDRRIHCRLNTLGNQPPQLVSRALNLIDCHETAASHLHQWLANSPAYSSCALLRVETESLHEKLTEWPQVKGLFYRHDHQARILRGLNRLLQGGLWFPRHICERHLQQRQAPRYPSPWMNLHLTPRERQVLAGIYAGRTNGQLAYDLKLSEHTIKSHLYSAYRKLGVRSRLEASRWLRDHPGVLDNLVTLMD